MGREHVRSLWWGALRGAAAGMVGTLALSAVADPLERRVLGRTTVYDPARMAPRLPLVRALSARIGAPAAGRALRWAYGPSLGAAYGLFRTRSSTARQRGPTLAGAVGLGMAVYGLELFALPLSGATAPACRWPAGDRVLQPLHTLVFGAVTDLVLGWSSTIFGPPRGNFRR